MKKLGIILALIICLVSVLPAAGVAGADDGGRTYPIMRPDQETLEEWIEAYNNAPRAYIEMKGFQVPSPGASLSLLDHLQYNSTERHQGSCENCWAWAGTGCLEIALDVQKGIKDRLSVQYINSCEYDEIEKTCCAPGWLSELADFYDATDMAIPWSNTNAHWQDSDVSCDTDCESISKTPNYPIASIQETTILTQTVSQATAIANIKNVLNQNKAVWFGFYLPDSTAWNSFGSFWNTAGETVRYDMDQFCGTSYNDAPSEGGGHAVLCVGYNDTVPANSYWIMLNSWGTTASGRPNGLFRIDMDMNYNCTYPGLDYSGNYAFYWQALDVTFGLPTLPDITVSPGNFDIARPPDATRDYTLTITNDGNADLNYDMGHWETTGMTAPAGAKPPDWPPPGEEGPLDLMELGSSEPMIFAPPPPLTGAAEELAYDDNEANYGYYWSSTGCAFAIRFTPSSYPVSLQTARICLWSDFPDSDHELFAVDIYDDDGAGGKPGTLLGSINTTAANWGWWDVDISGLGITIIGGDFYIAYRQLSDQPDCEALCADYDDHDGRSWIGVYGIWSRAEDSGYNADWMIRCVVEPPDCPWLSENPTSGTVVPGASHNITVSINTTGLGSNYTAQIVIASNDPDENPVVVPVNLQVGAPLTSYNITLYTGWNAISLPFAPDSTAIADITAAINANLASIQTYDAATGTWPWYIPGSPSSTLTTMEDGKGYWFFMNGPAILEVFGQGASGLGIPASPYDVFVGWNCIGFTSTTGMSPESYLASIAGAYGSIQTYDAATGTWPWYIPGVPSSSLTTMEPGHGYWLWATAGGTIVPPTS